MTPARNKPMASSEVPTGRRMNGAQTFMRREDRSPKTEGRKKAEIRSPKPPSRSDVLKVAVRLQPTGKDVLERCVASATLEMAQPAMGRREEGAGPSGGADPAQPGLGGGGRGAGAP